MGKKTIENNYYNKYDTHHNGKGDNIEPINFPAIKFTCYIIDGKIMCHYTKGKCNVDTILVAKACDNGEQLNSCSYMLNELYEGYEYVYKMERYFIYGYLVFYLAMMKRCPSKCRELTPIMKDHALSLKCLPWKTLGDPDNK